MGEQTDHEHYQEQSGKCGWSVSSWDCNCQWTPKAHHAYSLPFLLSSSPILQAGMLVISFWLSLIYQWAIDRYSWIF